MASDLITIPARRGKAAHLRRGQSIKIINTHGEQVIDTWAFVEDHMVEFMSMPHTRASLLKLIPEVGDALMTQKRRPILTLAEDTSSGIHDTLIAACDNERYGLLGCAHYHDNCTDNLHAGLAALGLHADLTPAPLNLFMNIPWADGRLSFEAPTSRKGDYVVLRAELDCVVAMSACPQDMLPINGVGCRPTEAHFQIVD